MLLSLQQQLAYDAATAGYAPCLRNAERVSRVGLAIVLFSSRLPMHFADFFDRDTLMVMKR